MRASLRSALQGLHRHQIVGPAAGAFLLRVMGAGLQFLFTLLLARFYGAAGVGVFVISLSLLVGSSAIARWGLDQTSLKLVAAQLASGDYEHIQSILNFSIKFIVLSATAGTLILVLLSQPLAQLFFEDAQSSAIISMMALGLLPLSLTTLFAEALRGLRRIVAYTALHGALIPLLSILFLLTLQELFEGVIAGALAYVLANVIGLLVAVALWFRALPRRATEEEGTAFDRRDLLRTSHSLAWVSIISVLMSFTETFVLGFFHDDADVGVYAAALRIALIINFITIAFNSILAPSFASLHRQHKLMEIQSLARHAVVVMIAFALPPIALCWLLPDLVLSMFGGEFTQGASALILLTFGQLIIITCGPVAILLQMTGQERAFRNNVIVSALTTLGTSVLLVPPYDVIGAALSAVIGIFLLNTLSLLSVRSQLGINPLPLLPAIRLRDDEP